MARQCRPKRLLSGLTHSILQWLRQLARAGRCEASPPVSQHFSSRFSGLGVACLAAALLIFYFTVAAFDYSQTPFF